MIFSIPFIVDWDTISKQRQAKSNHVENENYFEYDYVISEKVRTYQYSHFRKLQGTSLARVK